MILKIVEGSRLHCINFLPVMHFYATLQAVANVFGSSISNMIIFYLILLWSFVWKGIALWKSAKYDQRNWFIAILVLNTVGIVEIVYLFRFAKHKLTIEQVKHWVQTAVNRSNKSTAKK